MISVARLTDLTAPYSENNLFKLSTVVLEDRFCTIILVMDFFTLSSIINVNLPSPKMALTPMNLCAYYRNPHRSGIN